MHDIESFVNIGTAPIHCLQKNPPSKMMYLSLLCPKPWQDHKENPFCFDFLAFQTIVTTSSYVNYLAHYRLGKLDYFWVRLQFLVTKSLDKNLFGSKQEKIFWDCDPMGVSTFCVSIVCNLFPSPLM